MRSLNQIIKELEYNFNGNRRYQSIVFITDAPTGITVREIQALVQAIEDGLAKKGISCEKIDFFNDVVAKGNFPLGSTGNSFNELIDWIKGRTQHSPRCLLIFEIDPLLSTWNNSDISAFFKKLLYHDGIRMPVLIISFLAGKFSLPKNSLGQGLVMQQSGEEVL
jgi:hypothetical protein